MITIRKGSETLSFKAWDFPAGEIGVRLDTDNLRFKYAEGNLSIIARIQSHRDFMELTMIVDALREWDRQPTHLVLRYVPNGRQDRVCEKGDSFGLLAFARQIAALGFTHLSTFDPHSDVTPAVFKALGLKVSVVTQATIIGQFAALNKRLQPTSPDERPLFVSPDAGSNKKTSELAALYGHDRFIRADKLRDLATGKIKEIVVVNPREEVEGRDIVCPDDLCDAGGTFIGLAAALKAKGARSVELYVTHGLFTKEVDPLFNGGIDRIWTTNSYRTDLGQYLDPRLTVLNLEEAFPL